MSVLNTKMESKNVLNEIHIKNLTCYLKIFFWEYSFIMNKHNQKPTDILNKQDTAV